jgi:phosphonoacetate hydrolase
MNTSAKVLLLANQRAYKMPVHPTVVVCIDGCEPDYLAQAVAAGRMPWLKRTLTHGVALRADCALPSFTNPNNLSIVTGVPPSVHGISGNYFLDRTSGQAVMMNDPQWLRCPTLLAEASRSGLSVAVVTAKDKLRTLLGHGLRGICFSAECADAATLTTHGIESVLELVGRHKPPVYSAELSEFVFAAGVRLMETHRPDLMYLSTTDYVQHKHAPGTPQANDFYAMLDGYMAQLEKLGCVIALTADHGMHAKTNFDGTPRVIFLSDWLSSFLRRDDVRVILPITDPYVVHHGALGSFATVYLPDDLPADVSADAVCEALQKLQGIDCALPQEQAARLLELPIDRMGDVVVLADRFTALGTTPSEHDLSGLDAPLRSHGGRGEQIVPLIVNRPAPQLDRTRRWRNFDVFDIALNYAQ